MSFTDVLSEKRIAVPTPENVIDEFGNCQFGTFDKEFPKMRNSGPTKNSYWW